MRLIKSGNFHTKTNSNGEKHNNADNAKVFIAQAATAAYKGHVSPFQIKYFVIISHVVYLSFGSPTTIVEWSNYF